MGKPGTEVPQITDSAPDTAGKLGKLHSAVDAELRKEVDKFMPTDMWTPYIFGKTFDKIEEENPELLPFFVQNYWHDELSRNMVCVYFQYYKDEPYAKDRLFDTVVTQQVGDDMFERALPYFIDKPYAEEIFLGREQKRSATAFGDFEYYRKEKYAKNILLLGVLNRPIYALQMFKQDSKYAEEPYFDEVLKTAVINAASKSPKDLLSFHVEQFYEKPYAEGVISTLAETYSSRVLKALVDLPKEPSYIGNVLEIIARSDPWALKDHFDSGSDAFSKHKVRLLERCKKNIAIAEEGRFLPISRIKAEDLDIDRKTFELYLAGINHFQKERVARSEKVPEGWPLISIPMPSFRSIYFSDSFQSHLKSQVGKMTHMNSFSLAQAVYRHLENNNEETNEDTIKAATQEIHEAQERIKGRELFGPHVKLILFTHEEARFDNGELIEKMYKEKGGKTENILLSEKGVSEEDGSKVIKERVLESIRQAKVGMTTIVYSGHGGPFKWYFEQGQVDNLTFKNDPNDYSIHFAELGDALIESGNIRNINLIGSTCHSYDYLINLFSYLEKKGIKEKPFISIAAANKDRYGWGGGDVVDSQLLEALYLAAKKDETINVKHFFDAEALAWKYQDPALFVGTQTKYPTRKKQPSSKPEHEPEETEGGKELPVDSPQPNAAPRSVPGQAGEAEEAEGIEPGYYLELSERELPPGVIRLA